MQEDRAEARTRGLAEALRALKERTPHSYETLATRVGISRSALHRYCSGKSVPADFAVIKQLAGQCKASREELAELHRLWALATEPPAQPQEPEPEPEPEPELESEPDSEQEPEPKSEGAPEAGPEPEAEQEAEPATGRDEERGEEPSADSAAPAGELATVSQAPDSPGSRRRVWAIAAAVGAVALITVLAWVLLGGEEEAQTVADDRPLFTGECQEPVREGQHDECVREVQELLADTGVEIGIDGIFGPETLRRVEAFQVRAGLSVDGIVGDKTKRALYDGDVSLTTWDKKRVADRIREVFAEEPGKAVRIARCQSFLDPLHILPNTDTTRNWGVFQISDARLRDLRATPEKALDPEWNIKAAHELWSQNEDFSHWPHCAAAAEEEKKDDGEGAEDGADGS